MSCNKYYEFSGAKVLPPIPDVVIPLPEDIDPDIPRPLVIGGLSIDEGGLFVQQ